GPGQGQARPAGPQGVRPAAPARRGRRQGPLARPPAGADLGARQEHGDRHAHGRPARRPAPPQARPRRRTHHDGAELRLPGPPMTGPARGSGAPPTAGTILIIEDERDLIRLLKRALGEAGYATLSATSAESGLKLIRDEAPALILLDIALPAMDGLTFLRLLRKESQVPVILLSGRGTDVDRILGLKAGADDYVPKPFSLGELLARIACVLRRRSGGLEKKRRPSAS